MEEKIKCFFENTLNSIVTFLCCVCLQDWELIVKLFIFENLLCKHSLKVKKLEIEKICQSRYYYISKKLCINEVITYQHKFLFKFYEKQNVLCSISCNKPVWILNWPKPTPKARKKLYFVSHLQCNKLFNVNLICWLPDVLISWVKENYFKI